MVSFFFFFALSFCGLRIVGEMGGVAELLLSQILVLTTEWYDCFQL